MIYRRGISRSAKDIFLLNRSRHSCLNSHLGIKYTRLSLQAATVPVGSAAVYAPPPHTLLSVRRLLLQLRPFPTFRKRGP